MGAITPIASGLTSAVSTLNTISQVVGVAQTLSGSSGSGKNQDVALRQLQERQRLEEAQRSQQNALESERIALQSSQDEEDRQRSLRRAVARQRASFGGSGISSAGGSSQAVLLGLFDENEEELNQREQLDSLRNRALDLDASQASSLNLLQATQLRQRQNFQKEMSVLNSVNRLF